VAEERPAVPVPKDEVPPAPSPGAAIEPPPSAESVTRGRALFLKRCFLCHGRKADGDGPTARYLTPRPRNLVEEPLKMASAPGDPMGFSESGLRRVLRDGMPGTSMPRFRALPEADVGDLIAFLRSLRPDRTFVALASPERKGRAIYERLGCGRCHGPEGAGDGPSAAALEDDAQRPAVPTDLRRPRSFRSGSRREDVLRAVLRGVPGTPMPAYQGAAEESEIASLAAFVETLSLE
jgi:mono/diheme cytochrome c family protein